MRKLLAPRTGDTTSLNGSIYVTFQNGVGPQGQASTTGNRDSATLTQGSGQNERGWSERSRYCSSS